MDTILWIIQCLLSAVFAMAGWGKISSSKQQHIADGHIEPENSVIPIRILGALEWLGSIGIIVPWLIGILPMLTPAAAVCFGLIMISGLIIHTRKKEYKILPLLTFLLILSAVVAYFRIKQLTL